MDDFYDDGDEEAGLFEADFGTPEWCARYGKVKIAGANGSAVYVNADDTALVEGLTNL